MTKNRINLLNDELDMAISWLNLSNVVKVWAVVVFGLCILSFNNYLSYSSLEKQYYESKQNNQQLQQQLKQQQNLLSIRTIDSKRVKELNALQVQVASKQSLLAQLTDHNHVQTTGFAGVMTEFINHQDKEIELRKIAIIDGQINLSGFAKNADSIPRWLASFAGSTFMAEQRFSYLNLLATNDKKIQFSLQSNALQKGNK